MRPAELDELFDGSPVQMTPAMRRAAYASDMREAFPQHWDDEAADFAHRCAGAGYIDAVLARD